jgi:hypothetical protein
MEANKNFAKWLSCGIKISGTFGLHHVFQALCSNYGKTPYPENSEVPSILDKRFQNYTV